MKLTDFEKDFILIFGTTIILIVAAFLIGFANDKRLNEKRMEQIEKATHDYIEYFISDDINEYDHVIENHVEYLVTATVYHAVAGQCDDDYLITASGRKIKSTYEAYDHRYIAVSRDLRELFPYGSKVEVIGTGIYDGVYTVADTMNKRYTEYIDILINPDMKQGKWNNVVIRKL